MRAKLAIAALATFGLGCFVYVLSREYASGNVYGQYSSERTDRTGTAALYEALARTGVKVSRNYLPMRDLTASQTALFIPGIDPPALSKDLRDACEAAARKGNRVIVALNGGAWFFAIENRDIRKYWQFEIVDARQPRALENDASRQHAWFYFKPGPEWRSVQFAQGRPVAMERSFGNGSVAVVASSYPFSNLGLREDRDLAAIQWAIGDKSRVVFDESRLGSEEQGTVMGLIRQFRLQGLLMVSIVCALLFIWQSSLPFPPERRVEREHDFIIRAAGAGEGLHNLLTRHIEPAALPGICAAEWIRDHGHGRSAEELARIQAIAARKGDPLANMNEIRAMVSANPRERRRHEQSLPLPRPPHAI